MPPSSFSKRELTLWTLTHAATPPLLETMISLALPDQGGGLMIYAIPFSLGMVEAAMLRRRIRVPWLWPLLTLVGVVLSFFIGLGWFFIAAMGFGFGVAELPIIWASRYRWPLLWIPVSGCGWVVGFIAYSSLGDAWTRTASGDERYGLMYACVGLTYGLATGGYLTLAGYGSGRTEAEG